MLRDQIRDIIVQAVRAAEAAGTLPPVTPPQPEILRPKQPEHGDYSTNVAMILAASVRKETGEKSNPRQIAQAVVDQIPVGGADSLIGGVELAGPGFINLRLSEGWLQQQVAGILAQGESFGNLRRGEGQRWQVEYVSANPTGPLHFGGARNAVLGDTMANVLAAAGYDVQREFYVNDAGNQFDLFAATLLARYRQHFGQEAALPEGGYQGDYMKGYAAQIVADHGDRFLHMAEAESIPALKELGRQIVLADLKNELGLIGVVFDNWFSEQSLYTSGLADEVLAMLAEKGELLERDGATWFAASNYPKNDKDEVVIRSNGAPTYFASDIAYHYDKFVQRGFDQVINVWAVDHQGHVPRMAAVMQALGLDPARLTILLYNMVKLIRDGQEVKMSKRSGDFLTLREVVEEVGADPVRFMLLTRSPESAIDFDLDLAVSQNNDNPVYYVQYSHARICSILEKAEKDGLSLPDPVASGHLLSLLTHPAELDLIRKCLDLEEQIDLAVDKLSPHNLTHYAMELARIFNVFYRDCRVVDPAAPELSQARMLLAQAARTALAKVLALMGMSAPESM